MDFLFLEIYLLGLLNVWLWCLYYYFILAPTRKDYNSEDETDFVKPMSRMHPIRRSSSATARKSSGLAKAVTSGKLKIPPSYQCIVILSSVCLK